MRYRFIHMYVCFVGFATRSSNFIYQHLDNCFTSYFIHFKILLAIIFHFIGFYIRCLGVPINVLYVHNIKIYLKVVHVLNIEFVTCKFVVPTGGLK